MKSRTQYPMIYLAVLLLAALLLNSCAGPTPVVQPASTQVEAAAAGEWQAYTNTEAGFKLQMPPDWSQKTLPDENNGTLHTIAFSGPEGSVDVSWGVGFGGACTAQTTPVKLAEMEKPACYIKNSDGTESWGQIGYEVSGGNAFSVRAATSNSKLPSHDLVLKMLSTLAFMSTSQPGAKIANPASQNCLDKGGRLTVEARGDGGQIGVCYFEDNQQCEEWALMRGDCPVGGLKATGYITPAGRYCAITGGTYAVTGNSRASDEQGTCTFKDGSQCDAVDYYNGKCMADQASAPAAVDIQPLVEEVCNGQAQAMAHFLDVLEVTQSDEALNDVVNNKAGTGCMATVKGNGVKFKSPDAVIKTLGGMLTEQGWKEDDLLQAGGPTGMGAGYRKDSQICLASAIWLPDASANCSKDKPIAECKVTPEQQLYTITLICGEEKVKSNAPAAQSNPVALKDALPGLEPQAVFQNFYNLTQTPRPSGYPEKIRQVLVDFGNGLGLETQVDGAGNVLIRKPASAGMENRQAVILQAHMDMVGQKSDEKQIDFTKEPIQAFVDGEYIVTDGSTSLGADNGIGMALIMAILQSKTIQTGPLEALFTVDEETTMSGADGLQGDFLQGKILINLDGESQDTFTIGSAGGETVKAEFAYQQTSAPADMPAYMVKIQGLQGGHSGVDIDKGRGHATRLLVRLLKSAEEPFQLRLTSLSGGTAPNAIPRDAAAVILVPKGQAEAFTKYVKDYETTVRSELAATEPDLSVQLEATQPPAQVMDLAFQRNLLAALYGTPQGVLRMSDTVPGLVETSNNLGIVAVQEGQMKLACAARSSVDSELKDTEQMIKSVWTIAGYPVEISGWYSAWTPNSDSPILSLMKSTYQELFGAEPIVSAVHAGLECGTIAGKSPGMDMISYGPTMSGVHSLSEKLNIPSVEKTLALITEILKRIPER